MTTSPEQWVLATPRRAGAGDTGQRRRATDTAPPVSTLIDEVTVQGIADEAWLALVGEDEALVPLPGEPVLDPVNAWVDIVGPWNGAVVITTGRGTAEELTRCLLRAHAREVLGDEDVEDALGELANVGGASDTCRVEALWRGRPLSVTVQGPAARS